MEFTQRSVSMKLRTLTALILATMVSIPTATVYAQGEIVLPATDPAIETMTPEELVAARKAAMKEDGGLLRNAGSLSGADAVAAAETLVKNFTNFPHLFREGSIVGDSDALPAIWENWDTFTGIFAQARVASEAALVAAQANDMAAFGAALQGLGPLCGQCHQQFRVPD
jgi:cytochrome c556